ncbi:MAG: adenylyl-sulfate kinase [Pseudomonadota bacterium]
MGALANKIEQTEISTQDEKEQLNIVIVGHVDHGKSTLVGRIFHDTNSLPEGKFEQIQAMCKKRGMPFEYSFLMDALQAERDQGVTIDTTQIWFKTIKRDYCIIDAPGHKEFLKNMISGAALSEAAILLIDAVEGVKEQSMRHGYLLHLMGVRQIAVVINKMDMVNYSQKKFNKIKEEYTKYLTNINVEAKYFIPISAREGDNITNNSNNMAWYNGVSIIDALDSFEKKPVSLNLPLRLPVQDIYKFDERRIIVGKIETGQLNIGDELLFSPSNKRVQIDSIEDFDQTKKITSAIAGQSVGICLKDQIFVERGQMISHVDNAPVLTNIFRAKIFWIGKTPLEIGNRYKIKINTGEWIGEIQNIERIIDTSNLAHINSSDKIVERNCVAEIVIKAKGLVAIDEFIDNEFSGRFVILDDYVIVGGGIIDLQNIPDQRNDYQVKSKNIFEVNNNISRDERAMLNGHYGGVLWFSGLSGSGKTTLALELQQKLFEKGYQVYVLDGDNIRQGLNRDLGFSETDRSENLRRVGEVAGLFADSGHIVITAFISPEQADRHNARLAYPHSFHNVFIKADLETCEKRDVKGLYKKARSGEIDNFTGISAEFCEPHNPDLIIETDKLSIDESASLLMEYIDNNFVKPANKLNTIGLVGSGI